MKKLTFGLLGLLGILIVGLATLPFVVDVDKYRPEIVERVNSKIQGSFELGKLKLSLWGQLAIEAEAAKLFDKNKNKLVSVGNFKLSVPVSSLWGLKPEIKLVLKKPELEVKRDAQGTWNALTLLKTEKGAEPSESTTKTVDTSGSKKLPSWAERAAVSVFIEEASLKVEDLKTQSRFELDHLNLKTGNIKADVLPVFTISGTLETRSGKQEGPSGPFEISGEGKDSSLILLANFDKVTLPLGNFQKKAGSPTRLRAALKKDKEEWILEGKLEPVKITGDYLKQDLEVSADWKANSTALEKATLKCTANAFDVSVLATVKGFDNPKLTASVQSNDMDLDGLVDWVKMKKLSLEKEEAQGALKQNEKAQETKGATSGLVPKNLSGDILLSAKYLKAYKVRLEPIQGKFLLSNQKLRGSFEEATVLSGKLKASSQIDLASATPRYEFQTQVTDLNLQEAVTSQLELLKNTVTGHLTGEMNGKTEGFKSKELMGNLNASGKMKVANAKFTSFDINKLVLDGLGGVVKKVSESVPVLKGKEIKTSELATEFQTITTSFSIQNGEFTSSDFVAEAVPKRGLDFQGKTRVGLVDFSLSADWEVFDTYNLLQADPLLKERGKAFRIPLKVSGTLLSPKVDYNQIPETLIKIAVGNLGLAAKDKAQAEVKKQAESQLKKLTEQATPQVQKLFKGIFQ